MVNTKERVYSLHRYIDESGAPDLEKILSARGEKVWERHLDPGLIKIWQNQPDLVQREVRKHLNGCEDCKSKFQN